MSDQPAPFEWNQLFDALNIGLILVDQTGCILLWNDWIAKHSSVTADQA